MIGMKERSIQIAKDMLKEGDSAEKISRITKLSIEEIENISKTVD